MPVKCQRNHNIEAILIQSRHFANQLLLIMTSFCYNNNKIRICLLFMRWGWQLLCGNQSCVIHNDAKFFTVPLHTTKLILLLHFSLMWIKCGAIVMRSFGVLHLLICIKRWRVIYNIYNVHFSLSLQKCEPPSQRSLNLVKGILFLFKLKKWKRAKYTQNLYLLSN